MLRVRQKLKHEKLRTWVSFDERKKFDSSTIVLPHSPMYIIRREERRKITTALEARVTGKVSECHLQWRVLRDQSGSILGRFFLG